MIAALQTARVKEADALTDRQQGILSFIAQNVRDQGRPPSIREIADAFEIGSPNGVKCHLKALEAKGWIKRDRRVARGIRLLKVPTLPLVGKVSAGALMEQFAFYEDWSLSMLFPDLDSLVTAHVPSRDRRSCFAAGDTLLMCDGCVVGMIRQVA